jgi:dihydroorotate dehydrogenase (NAD+) catalytic subunit
VDASSAAAVVRAVKDAVSLPVIAKLSPNVTDIVHIAAACKDAGADALSLINTLLGMAIDVDKKRPALGNVFGGLSGPAVRPVAVRMVWQVYEAVGLPVIGMGGITGGRDAVEFILAGATAVAVGTGNFVDPACSLRVVGEIRDYMIRNGFRTVSEMAGLAHGPQQA